MQGIRFDEGYKEYMINDDPNRVIRFNPTDFEILDRIKVAYEEIEKATSTEDDVELNPDGTPIEQLGKAAETVKKISDTIKRQIDYIFNSPISDIVFGNQSPLCLVGGKPLYERFLDAIIPIIQAEVKKEQEASKKRIEKYTKQVK
jgi:hypothetical protein